VSSEPWRDAEKHRPTSVEALSAEVRRLSYTGLSELDIASALRLHVDFVRAALRGVA
jgi:hypothetical protein